MKNVKQLGIWMDHSNAVLLHMSDGKIEESNVEIESNHGREDYDFGKNETLQHNKEQHHQSSYYKKLSNIIKNYQEVLLFGPTNAKDELLNLLKTDHLFENIKIEVKHSDKMTGNQMHNLVNEYFK